MSLQLNEMQGKLTASRLAVLRRQREVKDEIQQQIQEQTYMKKRAKRRTRTRGEQLKRQYLRKIREIKALIPPPPREVEAPPGLEREKALAVIEYKRKWQPLRQFIERMEQLYKQTPPSKIEKLHIGVSYILYYSEQFPTEKSIQNYLQSLMRVRGKVKSAAPDWLEFHPWREVIKAMKGEKLTEKEIQRLEQYSKHSEIPSISGKKYSRTLFNIKIEPTKQRQTEKPLETPKPQIQGDVLGVESTPQFTQPEHAGMPPSDYEHMQMTLHPREPLIHQYERWVEGISHTISGFAEPYERQPSPLNLARAVMIRFGQGVIEYGLTAPVGVYYLSQLIGVGAKNLIETLTGKTKVKSESLTQKLGEALQYYAVNPTQIARLAGFIAGSIVYPYAISRMLPKQPVTYGVIPEETQVKWKAGFQQVGGKLIHQRELTLTRTGTAKLLRQPADKPYFKAMFLGDYEGGTAIAVEYVRLGETGLKIAYISPTRVLAAASRETVKPSLLPKPTWTKIWKIKIPTLKQAYKWTQQITVKHKRLLPVQPPTGITSIIPEMLAPPTPKTVTVLQPSIPPARISMLTLTGILKPTGKAALKHEELKAKPKIRIQVTPLKYKLRFTFIPPISMGQLKVKVKTKLVRPPATPRKTQVKTKTQTQLTILQATPIELTAPNKPPTLQLKFKSPPPTPQIKVKPPSMPRRIVKLSIPVKRKVKFEPWMRLWSIKLIEKELKKFNWKVKI